VVGESIRMNNSLTTCSEILGEEVGQDVIVCTTSPRSEKIPGCSIESLNSHVLAMEEVAKAEKCERKNHRPTKNERVATKDVFLAIHHTVQASSARSIIKLLETKSHIHISG
jgi:hypothetical protein